MINILLFSLNIVVLDSGQTNDIRNYINFESTKPPIQKKATIETVKNDISDNFPLTTNLKLGRVETKKLDNKYQSLNLALIGDDKTSIDFLKRNYKILKKHNTTLALISVESHKKYLDFKRLVNNFGLELSILNADFMFNDVSHYPVIIRNGVMLQ